MRQRILCASDLLNVFSARNAHHLTMRCSEQLPAARSRFPMIKHFHFDWRLLPVAVADLIIVRLMRSLALLSYFAVALCYATPPDVPFDKFDVGPPVHREGATTGYADMMQLGSTDYYA